MNILVDKKMQKFCEVLNEHIRFGRKEVSGIEFLQCGYKKDNTFPREGYAPFENGSQLDGVDVHYWFRFSITRDDSEENIHRMLCFKTGRENQWDAINPQGLIYINGKIVQGIDINHTEVLLTEKENDVYLYFYTGMNGGKFNFSVYTECVDRVIENAYYDFKVPCDACFCAKEQDENRILMLKHLEIAANKVDLRQPRSEEFYKTLREATDYLKEEFYKKVCGNSSSTVNCIGHTHIDVAWLWTLAQTVEKTQRSFSTVLNLMKQYPEYKFMSSQPQLYAYLKESAPEVYEQIKERVKEGRWEVEGAMWLEADCNLISGESMVRQIIHGKRFMKEEFGVDSHILWLPDVFGYSAAMPQILRKCGVTDFVTSKISWNDSDKMPYDTFLWEGIDGSEILTNFITAQYYKSENAENFTTYVGMLDAPHIKGTWNRYQQKNLNNETVLTYGFGDGGGGPTKGMIENYRRLKYGLPGLPKAVMTTAEDYLTKTRKNFEKSCEELKRTPKWVGELYLELHRGTYTSIAKNKKNNRECEFLLQSAEAASETAKLLLGREYPAKELYNSWQTVLLNQFHDIIPGSSIEQVYKDSDVDYKNVRYTAENALGTALKGIADNLNTKGGMMIYNPTGFTADGIVEYDGDIYETDKIPAFGWRVSNLAKGENRVKIEGNTAENDYYVMKLDNAGRIESLYDKAAAREVFKEGEKGNELQIFEDQPYDYDNWEIAPYYKQKMWIIDGAAEITPVEFSGGAGFKIKKKYLDSEISQTVMLYNNSKRIDFKTELDWKEEHQVMKAAFPLDIHTNKATYEIQFGNTERPTHSNTSWDAAKFEVCAHKWADISENGYGVSLLNNCKYGYNAEGSTLKLTLLKCGTHPNKNADKGHHEFTYSLLPHLGDYRSAGTVREAYIINNPMRVLPAKGSEGKLPENFSMVSADKDNIVIDTLKKAYDSEDMIIRLYDAFDRRENVTLTLGNPPRAAYLCDMLENEIGELEVSGNQIKLPIKNFEIATVKVKFR